MNHVNSISTFRLLHASKHSEATIYSSNFSTVLKNIQRVQICEGVVRADNFSPSGSRNVLCIEKKWFCALSVEIKFSFLYYNTEQTHVRFIRVQQQRAGGMCSCQKSKDNINMRGIRHTQLHICSTCTLYSYFMWCERDYAASCVHFHFYVRIDGRRSKCD